MHKSRTALSLACMLGGGLLMLGAGLVTLGAFRIERLECASIEIAGEAHHLVFDSPVARGDNLGIRGAVVHAIGKKRAQHIRAGESTALDDQMLLVAAAGSYSEGRACVVSCGWSCYRFVGCSAGCAGSWCVRVVAIQ